MVRGRAMYEPWLEDHIKKNHNSMVPRCSRGVKMLPSCKKLWKKRKGKQRKDVLVLTDKRNERTYALTDLHISTSVSRIDRGELE